MGCASISSTRNEVPPSSTRACASYGPRARRGAPARRAESGGRAHGPRQVSNRPLRARFQREAERAGGGAKSKGLFTALPLACVPRVALFGFGGPAAELAVLGNGYEDAGAAGAGAAGAARRRFCLGARQTEARAAMRALAAGSPAVPLPARFSRASTLAAPRGRAGALAAQRGPDRAGRAAGDEGALQDTGESGQAWGCGGVGCLALCRTALPTDPARLRPMLDATSGTAQPPRPAPPSAPRRRRASLIPLGGVKSLGGAVGSVEAGRARCLCILLGSFPRSLTSP